MLTLDTLPCVRDLCFALKTHSVTKTEHPMTALNGTTAAVIGIHIL